MPAADPALVGDCERSALEFFGGDFAVPDLLRHGLKLFGELKQILGIHVPNHRDDQTGLGIDRHPDVIVLLEHQLLRRLIEARIKCRMFLKCFRNRLERERSQCQPSAFLLIGRRVLLP